MSTSARHKDPCAFLRTKFGGLSKSQAETVRACDARDRDGSAAAIAWLLQRYKPFDVHVSDSDHEGSYRVWPVIESLPWNPAAPPRIVRLELREKVYHYNQTKRGRGAFSHASWDLVDSFTVPHWDYDGVDPLIAREPWEREEANRMLDLDAAYRRSDRDKSWCFESIVHNLECGHKLNEEGSYVDMDEAYAEARLKMECPL